MLCTFHSVALHHLKHGDGVRKRFDWIVRFFQFSWIIFVVHFLRIDNFKCKVSSQIGAICFHDLNPIHLTIFHIKLCTIKSRAVDCFVRMTSKDFQTVQEVEVWCLCTVTFCQLSSKLISRPVYCSRLYGIFWLKCDERKKIVLGINLKSKAY